MAAPLAVAVVHLLVRLEILALQVKSGPSRDSRLWLRPAGRAMTRDDPNPAKSASASPATFTALKVYCAANNKEVAEVMTSC
jgi:hypothetical protein